MSVREVKILGLKELQAKVDWDVLAQPEFEDVRDTIVGRMMRGGKGRGVQRNTPTTRVFPRTRGTAWAQYQEKVVKGIVARNAIKKAIERIEARWAQGS